MNLPDFESSELPLHACLASGFDRIVALEGLQMVLLLTWNSEVDRRRHVVDFVVFQGWLD
jgi:hypothetical protein